VLSTARDARAPPRARIREGGVRVLDGRDVSFERPFVCPARCRMAWRRALRWPSALLLHVAELGARAQRWMMFMRLDVRLMNVARTMAQLISQPWQSRL